MTPAVRLNCACLGPADGTPVVFLHGVSNSLLWWQLLRVALAAEGYLTIGVDSLGHGASPRLGTVDRPEKAFELSVAAAREVLAALGRPAYLIGHSMGGAIATALGREHPELINALILADPAWLSPEQERRYRDGASAALERTRRWQRDPVAALAENTAARPHWSNADHLAWLYGQLHVDLDLVATGVVSFPAPWQELVADLDVRTHVVTSGADCLVGESGAAEIRHLGRASLTITVLPGATHSLPIDLPAQFGAEVRRVLAEDVRKEASISDKPGRD
ncbi:MAG: alpha/beta hydrolase [Corynebacterium sp.]|uniref:alpha/beta fold hydrolase n=1 Tax=Corynebacterium sp. TaxID=1720 RepID=UPI0026E0C461|nr:alpha/beta hydrolase [Corynebacterium sp.]MDO5670969.1 alpha/beta hydrolase [Corynebacterium sp.]